MSFPVRDCAFGAIRRFAFGGRLRSGLLLFCTTLPLFARAALEPQPYRIDDWQAEHGLPQSSVTSIVQTRDGYLWLGTFHGLARFDGVQFKVFNPNNTPGLPSSRILQLFEDRQGALWIATEEGSLARFAEGRFQAFPLPDFLKASGYIHAFAETAPGALWMMTSGHQLLTLADGRFTLTPCHWDLSGTQLGGMTVDNQGQLWIGTGKEIAVRQGNQFQGVLTQDRNENSGSVVLAASHAGGFWTGENGRLRRFDGGRWAADYGAYPWSKGALDCMMEDRNGQLWIGTYGSGLFCYATNGAFIHLSTQEGLPGDLVRSLYEDREGNIWAGLEGCGLARLKPAIFRSYGRQQGLSGDCVLSVCEGAEGELWIGTNGDGVDRLKNGVVRHFGAGQGLANEFVWSLLEDRSKTLWAGTWGGGLFRLREESFVPFENAGGSTAIVCALYEDAGGSLWVGEQRTGPEILRLREGKPILCPLRSRLPNADVRAVAEDKAGDLWIGTQGDGLYRIHQDRQTHYDSRNGLSSEFIRSLYADAEGVLWVGTYGSGLSRVEGERITNFSTKDGLANDALCYLTEDSHSNLWCGSLGGVFRVAKAELNRFARGQTRAIHCIGYTTADGLPSLECSGGNQPSGCKSRDGRLWFPTVRGLAVVDPENVTVNPLPPPVVIEEVLLEGKAMNSNWTVAVGLGTESLASPHDANGTALKVPPGNQRLEFQYTGLSLTAPKKVRFEYKLEGLEEDWVDAGTRRAANYSHLRPGDYRFCVRACNNDGVWNDKGASLALIILPYFWQTWWFRSLAAVGMVLLFVAVYEARLASQRKLTRLRLRIARDLHDEVGSNLGSIALLSEMMPKTPAEAADEAAEIRRISVQTINSLRDIVWFLDPASDDMEDLVLRMKETAKSMLPGIPFGFVSDGATASTAPSLELRRNVFPMFKETLHNIAKHARATRVEILVNVNSRRFRFQVSDNGVGFDEAQVRPGNGLKNLRRRAAELGGTLEIRSQPDHGAQVTFTAPIP